VNEFIRALHLGLHTWPASCWRVHSCSAHRVVVVFCCSFSADAANRNYRRITVQSVARKPGRSNSAVIGL